MPFLRNTWYVAMWSLDLSPGELRHRTLLGEPIVFYRKHDGGVAALADQCPHRFVPLHRGTVCDGDRLRCGYHGLEFDASGTCVRNPHGGGHIAAALKVRSYVVVEKHSLLWIWMGEAESGIRPDPARIPDFSVLDEDSLLPVSKRDCIKMDSNYRLITDNLLDLSHVSFLHDGILGNEDTVDAEVSMEQKGQTVYVTRFMPKVRPPGMFDLLYKRDGELVDLWFTMRWDSPGYMLNDAGCMPVGGDKSQGTGIFGAHLLTPETETTTYYHFAAARQNPLPFPPERDTEIKQKLADLRRYAFEEQDEPMIRMQQEALMRHGGLDSMQPVLLTIDVGPVRARRLLDASMRAESESSAGARLA